MLKNEEKDKNEYFKAHEKLKSIIGFNGKQKIDLLNYFMSELLENVLSERVFYAIDCIIKKNSVHKISGDTSPLRRIDI